MNNRHKAKILNSKIGTKVKWYVGDKIGIIVGLSRQGEGVVIVEWDTNFLVTCVNVNDLVFLKTEEQLREEEILRVLDGVGTGDIAITSRSDTPADQYCGHIKYHLSNGYVVTAFNDCNNFDYIDSIEFPDNSPTVHYGDLELVDFWLPKCPEHWGFQNE